VQVAISEMAVVCLIGVAAAAVYARRSSAKVSTADVPLEPVIAR
jgi:hypothetical protein